MKYKVVIPAAGSGKRMGAKMNKLFIPLNNIPIIIHTLKVFEDDPWCEGIILVVNQHDQQSIEQLVDHYQIRKVQAFIPGGQERQNSVYAGLKAINDNDDSIVLIHDGARPFLQQSSIHELVLEANKVGGAILATPVKDTIKRAKNEYVESTIERSLLWSVQTPQAFRLADIKLAHEDALKKQFIGTDDASLLENIGRRVKVVNGTYYNIKITTPEDLLFAEAILAKMEKQT
ncbi:2-C-methyl-D-erythritol 4-phosphate cytidylyltransferase [Bacillus kwashiorkori]|uniref:2-C-methyl-D-erythritol 4-phosphate cytidylyltransferase n=1 Tax=Bacillus kwashiorkori TaxID=1522318 RepID=UPI0007820984|nr:2-C-methyl-D-erythritol 4-phosphate cytidylyltransferase [Bacillus kwashiorkori]